MYVVAALPRSLFAWLDNPAPVPASNTYEDGAAPAGADHENTIVAPVTVAVSPDGAPGAAHGTGVGEPTTTTASFEAGPVPADVAARTRA